jgi:serine/threonine protein phosphatase PrpC
MVLDTDSLLKIAKKNRPFRGEFNSGDLPFYYQDGETILLGLIDAVGHGNEAFKLSARIKKFLNSHWHTDFTKLLNEIDHEIKASIGAAISLVSINLSSSRLNFAGVGNVNVYLIGQKEVLFVSRDGVVGQNMRTPLIQTQPLIKRDKVILCSDGIQERFYSLADRKILARSPEHVVNYIQKEYGKDHDDASCLVYEF